MMHDNPADDGIRLQKLMAAAGVASRRVSEDLISAGRVEVNGEVVMELGRRVQETDLVSVDGVAIQLDTSRRYLMLNKPVGIVSSLQDDRGRPDLHRFVSQFQERLFNVGRLDAQTSGLLILTNDGELAHVLAHPSFGVLKTYIARVEGRVTPATVQRLFTGIDLEDGPIKADKARIIDQAPGGDTIVEITLHSGRNRIVRRMLEEVGHPVVDLVRRQFGPLHLGTLASGQLRDLTKAELGQLLTISRDAVASGVAAETDDAAAGSGAGAGAGAGVSAPAVAAPASRATPTPLVVAVDGPAGSGKSSVSRAAARALGFAYLDTGAAYRALAWGTLEAGVDAGDSAAVIRSLADFRFEIGTDPENYFVWVGETAVTQAIREPRVTAVVSQIAGIAEVRSFLVELFRSIIAGTDRAGIVVEGRDITTVVAPDAGVRILLTASEEARMARRSAEISGQSAEITSQQLASRDRQDSKVVDFMNAADGVTTVDSTLLDFNQTVSAVVALVNEAAA